MQGPFDTSRSALLDAAFDFRRGRSINPAVDRWGKSKFGLAISAGRAHSAKGQYGERAEVVEVTIYYPDGTDERVDARDEAEGLAVAQKLLGATATIELKHVPGAVVHMSDVAMNPDAVGAYVGKEYAIRNEQLMTWYQLSQGVDCVLYGPAVLVR